MSEATTERGDAATLGGGASADPSRPEPAAAPATLAAKWPVVICCGPGGVGKTTVSAAFALQAARLGRRACVVTVDPARRLADALGIESLTNAPTLVEGPWPGTLSALMLDARRTFDELVERYASSPEQVRSISSNRLYQSLAGALSGTQEYMAMEKLYELTTTGDYDIVVVDTPPTRNALDLLDAPGRLTSFLDNRIFRTLMLPTRVSLRAVNLATQALLRTIARVAGAEIVQDAVAFFQAFAGMERGFTERAGAVRTLLADPSTAYVVVTSPRPDAVEEASYFAAKLAERGAGVAALVVNRVQPSFGNVAALPEVPPDSPLAPLVGNALALDEAARLDEGAYADLVAQLAPAPVARVPLLWTDVHDVAGLGVVADRLFGPGASADGAPAVVG